LLNPVTGAVLAGDAWQFQH